MPVYPAAAIPPGLPGALVGPYSYEFRGFAFGSGTPYITEEVDGLLSFEARDEDQDRTNDHGVNPGVLLMGKRIIAFDLKISGAAGLDIEQKIREASVVFQVPRRRYSRTLEPLIFQRPGDVKKVCYVRCTKRDFPSNYKTARGLVVGSVELQAPDPRIFSLTEYNVDFDLGATVTVGSFFVDQQGDFSDGTPPTITISGPFTNPTIQNLADDERTFKLNGVFQSDDKVRIDFRNQRIEVSDAGGPWVENFGILANDSQWWSVLPGVNEIVYARSPANAGGASDMDFQYRDVWQ